jgi:hypothetical protein
MTGTRLRWVVALAAAFGISGCGDDGPLEVPSEPGPAPALFGGPGDGLVSCSPIAPDSETKVVGPGGGELRVGPHVLTVPAGALDQPVAITAAVTPESVNRIEFAPAGLTFGEPASLTMSYANCGLLATLWPKRIAFLESDPQPGLLPAIAEIVASTDNLLSRRVTGAITHFSSYAIAW